MHFSPRSLAACGRAAFALTLLAGLALSGCNQRGVGLPASSASPFAGAQAAADATATPKPTEVIVPKPTESENLPTVAALSAEEVHATGTAEALLHSVQTEYALTQNLASPTPCGGSCPTSTPTPRRTPTPTITTPPSPPLAALRILRPGALSRVVSPIFLEASVIAGADGVVRVELVGEDGRTLYRQVLRYGMPAGARFVITASVEFEIPLVAETGRLQVSTEDSAGRPIALSSVELVLLSVGSNELNPAPPPLEPFNLLKPQPGQVISGGVVEVGGLVRPVSKEPIVLELIDNQGAVISSRQILAPPTENGSAAPLTATIPYQVKAATPVRLVIRQPDSRIPGDAAISSILLTLTP